MICNCIIYCKFCEKIKKLKKQMQEKKEWENKLIGLTKKEIEKLYKNNVWEKNNGKNNN